MIRINTVVLNRGFESSQSSIANGSSACNQALSVAHQWHT
jgi:hypothetical protein